LIGAVSRPIVDAETKRTGFEESGVPLADTIAVGEGAHEIPMLARAGLGVACHAKPDAAAAADTHVHRCDRTVLIWAQDHRRAL